MHTLNKIHPTPNDATSVTKFGQILKVFGQFLVGLFGIWQTFVPTLAFLSYWENAFGAVNGQRLNNNIAI